MNDEEKTSLALFAKPTIFTGQYNPPNISSKETTCRAHSTKFISKLKQQMII